MDTLNTAPNTAPSTPTKIPVSEYPHKLQKGDILILPTPVTLVRVHEVVANGCIVARIDLDTSCDGTIVFAPNEIQDFLVILKQD